MRPSQLCVIASVLCAGLSVKGEPVALAWTPEERAFIASHPMLRVGYNPDPPYAFAGADGKWVGIDPDFLALIEARTGLRFEARTFASWPEVLAEFKAGRLDLLPELARLPEREAWLIYTRPYMSAPNVVVTRDDTPYVIDLRELSGRRVGVPRGYAGVIDALRERSPGCILVEFDGMDDALAALAKGDVDAAVDDVVSASWNIRSRRFTNLRLGSVIASPEEDSYGVRKDLPVLAQIMNKTIASITPRERSELNDRWIHIDVFGSAWVRIFKIVAAVAALATGLALFVVFNNRRLARALAERMRMQAALTDAHARLAKVSEEKSAILQTVAHDLRSPITALQVGVELLADEAPGLTARGREIVSALDESVTQMEQMVADLVDVQVLEEGRRDYHPSDTDVVQVLRESAASFSDLALRKGIRLTLDQADPGPRLHVDARALRQVIDNLVSNAVKYSPTGSEVRVSLLRRDGVCRAQVVDGGPGVKPEERETIFDKYRGGTARPTGGERATGLGLWIVRRLVTEMKGRVWCEDGPGGAGAAFVVELPAA